jgi:hypothetical protein
MGWTTASLYGVDGLGDKQESPFSLILVIVNCDTALVD